MRLTASRPSPESEAGPSFTASSQRENSSATSAASMPNSSASSRTWRMAASTLAATARPCTPWRSSLASQPDSRTAIRQTSAMGSLPTRSQARPITRRAAMSRSEGATSPKSGESGRIPG